MTDLGGMEIAFLVFSVIVYFAPTILAIDKHHPSPVAVFIVNLLLGWTIIGWIVALMWATGAPTNVINPVKTVSPIDAAIAPTNQSTTGITEEIRRLAALKAQGLITEEEFTKGKSRILEKGNK